MHPCSTEWSLTPGVTFLNHGSFGATPRAVLAEQHRFRAEMEAEPVRFMVERLEPLLDDARRALGGFVHASPGDLVFVPNATAAVNAVVRSMDLAPGDELLTINHAYNACINVLRYVGERTGAKVVVAELEPFPTSPGQIAEAFLRHVTPRTKLAMVCHVTSPTALVVPVETLVPALQSRGVRVLVDGAHAPGMLDVNLTSLNADYYTANLHKWLCAPKGCAFLHVRADRQSEVRPHIISHGMNSRRVDRSRFMLEFDWTGTLDPTAWLCVPACIKAMADIWNRHHSGAETLSHADAWRAIRARNHALCATGRRAVASSVGSMLKTPESMFGTTAAIPLPPGRGEPPKPTPYPDPIQRRLIDELGVQVPIVHFPAWPNRLVRISTQLYNNEADYDRLAEGLKRLLP